MVRAVDIHDDHRARRDDDVPDTVIIDSHTVDHPERWVQAQRLLNDLRRKRKAHNVSVGQRPVAENRPELIPYALQGFRMHAEEIK